MCSLYISTLLFEPVLMVLQYSQQDCALVRIQVDCVANVSISMKDPNFLDIQTTLLPKLMPSLAGLSAATDIAIALGMCYLLNRNRADIRRYVTRITQSFMRLTVTVSDQPDYWMYW